MGSVTTLRLKLTTSEKLSKKVQHSVSLMVRQTQSWVNSKHNLFQNSSNKQCILDPIPRLLKECNSELSPVITKIINLSIDTSTVPTEFKQAVVTPLVKKPNAKLEYKIIDQCQTFHIFQNY